MVCIKEYEVRPFCTLVRAVHKREGFLFSSTERVTQLANSLLLASPFSKGFNRNELYNFEE